MQGASFIISIVLRRDFPAAEYYTSDSGVMSVPEKT
jgi:hypothetical protein